MKNRQDLIDEIKRVRAKHPKWGVTLIAKDIHARMPNEFLKEKGKGTMSLSSLIWNAHAVLNEGLEKSNEYTERRDEDGTIKIKDVVDRKLSDQEIFSRYGRSPLEWRISMVWFKDKSQGRFLLSCCFIPLLKEIKEGKYKEELLKAIKQLSPSVKLRPYKKQNGKLLEIDIFDPHFGKLAWREETGEDYDISIAEERYLEAVSSLLHQAASFEKVERILFPVGNDLMHTDTIFKTTTAGTLQDTDTRWQKMWLRTRIAVMKAVTMCTEVAPVDIKIVQSNHDFQTIFYLGDLLSCYYEKNKNITVDNSSKSRKYYEFGKCGIGFTHGNEENVKDLPMIMLREKQKEWALMEFMEWHIGHWHKRKQLQFVSVDDVKGISVRYLRSLSGTDSWHYVKGYCGSIKGAEAFLWDKEYGMTANLNHNL